MDQSLLIKNISSNDQNNKDKLLSMDSNYFLDNILRSKGFNIKTKGNLDIPFFHGIDFLKIIGCFDINNNIKSILSHLPNELKIEELPINENNNEPSIYLNKKGIIFLIENLKLINMNLKFINLLNNIFDLKIVLKYLSKEQECINNIIESFSNLIYDTEYEIENYKVDLFFINYRLFIDCDKLDTFNEIKEEYIKTKYKCKYIRINPYRKDFSIFKVINNIYKYINKIDLENTNIREIKNYIEYLENKKK